MEADVLWIALIGGGYAAATTAAYFWIVLIGGDLDRCRAVARRLAGASTFSTLGSRSGRCRTNTWAEGATATWTH
jgi:hypothetical protein